MTAQPIELPDPLTAALRSIEAAFDAAPIDLFDRVDESRLSALTQGFMRIGARAAAYQAAGARAMESSGLARRSGASSTGSLLAGAFGGDRAAGDRLVRQGQALEAAPATEQALAAGEVTERQAKAIAGAVGGLGPNVRPHQRRAVEEKLLADAQNLTAKDLERRALRAADAFKPEREVDADENAQLEDRERRAWDKAEFRIWDNRDGTHSGSFTVPEAQADLLRAAVEAYAAPRRDHLADQPLTNNRMGRGFAELCSHLAGQPNPDAGPTMYVRFDHDTLVDGVRAATLDSGTRVSAGEARLMSCRLGLLPAVFSGSSVAMDHGRTKRLFTPAQKAAIANRDGGCAFPGCDRPPQWCEAHHWRLAWALGGRTDVADGVLLCAHHHRVVHNQRWDTREAEDGVIEFRPPGSSIWKRNHRWRT